jgi:protein pelota
MVEKECWDTVDLDRISQACDPAQCADLAAVVLQEGLARICLITSSMTLTKATIEVSIPRKRQGLGSQFEKARLRFFDQVYEAISREIDFAVVQCVLLASPGFTKDEFFEHFQKRAVQAEDKALLASKNKFVLVSVSSGHKDAIREVLADPAVAARLADTKAAREVRAISDFYKMLDDDPDRAYYGYNHVARANEAQAIKTLMVTDSLFRAADIPTRRRYIALVEAAQDNGATIRIFSALHVSGERLAALSGIAALLRYPMPEIADVDDGEDSSDDEVDGARGGRAGGGAGAEAARGGGPDAAAAD